jgi:hypothetical protein
MLRHVRCDPPHAGNGSDGPTNPSYSRFREMNRSDGLLGAAIESCDLALTPASPGGRRGLGRHEGGIVIALGDRRQITDHFIPMLAAVVATPYFTSGRCREQ